MTPLRVGVIDYNGKSRIIQEACRTLGHTLVRPWELDCDVLFADTEVWWAPPYPQKRRLLEQAARRGVPIVLYPHGTVAHIMYDGVWKPDLPVAAHLVNGPGHVDLLEAFGYRRRLVQVGWTYCKTAPFHRPARVVSVLLGTVHAMANGAIMDYDHNLNVRTVHALTELDVPVRRIRYVGPANVSGVDRDLPGIELVAGAPDQSYRDIDAADVVVASGTFAWMAVARGKPTVMVGSDIPMRDTDGTDTFRAPDHWDTLAPLFRYPVDFDDGPLPRLIEEACREPVEWRDRFIGGPFNLDVFAALLEEFTPRARPRPARSRKHRRVRS